MTQRTFKMRLLRGTASLVIACFLLTTGTNSAQAQIPVTDLTLNYKVGMLLGQLGINASATAAGQAIQSKTQSIISGNLADLQTANNQQILDRQDAGRQAVESHQPNSYSSCQHGLAASAASLNHTQSAAVVRAMAQTAANIPANTSAAATQLDVLCKLGLVPSPSDTTDPDAARLPKGCVSDGKHKHQTETIATLLLPLEYSVPPNFTLTNDNSYHPITSVPSGSKDYYPFVMSLMICQNLAAPSTSAPKGTVNTSTAILAVPAAMRSKTMSSFAPTACFKALEDRAQYGTEVDAKLKPRHDAQVLICETHHDKGYITDAQLTDCQKNGRSTWQAAKDFAFRAQSPDWRSKELATLAVADNRALMETAAEQDQEKFYDKLMAELNNLKSAYGGSTGGPSIGPLDQAVGTGQ